MNTVKFIRHIRKEGNRWVINIPKELADKMDKQAVYQVELTAIDTVSPTGGFESAKENKDG